MANAQAEGVAERVGLCDGDAAGLGNVHRSGRRFGMYPAAGDRNQAPAPADGESPARQAGL
jgi:hypothetical protein